MNKSTQLDREDWEHCVTICRLVDDGAPCGIDPLWPDANPVAPTGDLPDPDDSIELN